MSEKKEFWFRRYPRLSMALFLGLAIVLLLLVAELFLRAIGNKPGVGKNPSNMTLVTELEFNHDYINDEFGIFKVGPKARQKVCSFLEFDDVEPLELENLDLDYSLEKVTTEFDRLETGELEDEEFVSFYHELNQKKPEELNQADSAYLEYFKCPINADGFRSIPFGNHRTNKTKVLLLGDSFTWGLACEPLTNCFADRLSARGYMVYNTGIIGTDPPQYLSIMKKYLKDIMPDIVVINFFMGNDQMDWIRTPSSQHTMNYVTNAGWLGGYIEGCYVSAEESYDINLRGISIPKSSPSVWSQFCRKSVLGTKFWFMTTKTEFPLHYIESCDPKYDPPISEHFIKEIEKLGAELDIPVLLALIPFHKQLPGFSGEIEDFEQSAPKNFPNVNYHFPTDLKPEDYVSGDDHFNKEGMRKYADFLQILIDSSQSK